MWQRDTSGECPDDEDMNSTNITDGSTSYDISGLFGISTYRVTVRATNEAGTALSNELLVMTTEAGNICSSVTHVVHVYVYMVYRQNVWMLKKDALLQLLQLHLTLSELSM